MPTVRSKTLDIIIRSQPPLGASIFAPVPVIQLAEPQCPLSHISLFFIRTGGEFGYAVCGGQDEMTKADLVEKVTRLGDLTRRDGEIIVETIFDSVITALQGGGKIEIRGFGSFGIRQRNPRIGRNPKTGERVEVPAK